MLHHFQISIEISTESSVPPDSDVLRERCKVGVKAALGALDNFSVGFASMRTLSGEYSPPNLRQEYF